jgi:hypothetical protein
MPIFVFRIFLTPLFFWTCFLLAFPSCSLFSQITRFEFIDEPNGGEQDITDDDGNAGPTILSSFIYTVVNTPADVVFMNQIDVNPAAFQSNVIIGDPDEGIASPEIPLFEGITFLYPYAKHASGSNDPWVLGPLTLDGSTPLLFKVDQGPPRAPDIGGFTVEGGRILNLVDPNLRSHFVNLTPQNPDVLLEIVFNRHDVDLTSSLELSFIGTVTNNTALFDPSPGTDPDPDPVAGAVDRPESLADVVAQLGRILSGVPVTGPPLSAEVVGDVTTKTGPFPLNVPSVNIDPPNASDPPDLVPAQSGPSHGLFNPIGFDFRGLLPDGDYEITVGARDVFNQISPGAFAAFGNLSNPTTGVPARILVRKDTIAPQDILLERPRSVFIFGNTPPAVDPPFEDSIFIMRGTVNDERGDFARVHILSQDSPDIDGAVDSANHQLVDALFVTDRDTGILESILDARAWSPQVTDSASQVAYRMGFALEDLSGNMNTKNAVELLMIKDFFAPLTPVFTNVNNGDAITTTLFSIQAEADNSLDLNAEHGSMIFQFSISLVTATSGIIPLQSVDIPASTSALVPMTNSLLDDSFLTFQREIKILDPQGVETGQVETMVFTDRTDAFDNLVYEKFFLNKVINFSNIPDGILRLDLCLLDQVGNKSDPCTSVVVVRDTSGPVIELELGNSGPDDNYTTSFPTLPNFPGADDRFFRLSLKSPELTVDDGPGGSFPDASVPDPHFRISSLVGPASIALLLKGSSNESFGFTTRIDVSGGRIPSFSILDSTVAPSGTDLDLEFRGSVVTLNQPSFTPGFNSSFEIRIPLFNLREGLEETLRFQAVDNLGNQGPIASLRLIRDVESPVGPQILLPTVPPGFTRPLIYTNQDLMDLRGVSEPGASIVIFLPPENSPPGFIIDSLSRIALTSPSSVPIAGSDFDSLSLACAALKCFFVDAGFDGSFQLQGLDISTVASSLSTPTTLVLQAIDSFDNTDPVSSVSFIEVHRNTLEVPVDRLFVMEALAGGPPAIEIFPDSQGVSPGKTVFFSSEIVKFRLETLFPMLEAPDLALRQQGGVFLPAGKLLSVFPLELGTFEFRYHYQVPSNILDFDGPVDFQISGGQDFFGNPVSSTTGAFAFMVDTVAPNEFSSAPLIITSPQDSVLMTTFISVRIDLQDYFKDGLTTEFASGVATDSLKIDLFGPLQQTPDSLNSVELITFLPVNFGFDLGAKLSSSLETDGTYRLEFLAEDLAGNQTRYNRSFLLDRQNIAVPLLFTAPAQGEFISTQPFDISLGFFNSMRIEDLEADLERSDFLILNPDQDQLGTQRSVILSTNTVVRSFTSTSLPATDGSSDGIYTLDLSVVDRTGNLSLKRHSFTLDSLAPVLTRIFPSVGSCVSNLELVQFEIQDDGSFTSDISGLDRERSTIALFLEEGSFPDNPKSPGTEIASRIDYLSEDGEPLSTERVALLIEEGAQGLPQGGSYDGKYQIQAKFRDRASNGGTLISTFIFDSIPPSLELSGLADQDFLTHQAFQLRGFITDRGPCGLLSAGSGNFATETLELQILDYDPDTEESGALLAGPFFPESLQALAVSLDLASSRAVFILTGVFPAGQERALFQWRVRDGAGNTSLIERIIRLHDSLPPLPKRLSPLSTTRFRSLDLTHYTSTPIHELRWELQPQAKSYRLHLSRESLTPSQRTTAIILPGFTTSYSVDYTQVLSTSSQIALGDQDQFFWIIEAIDAAGKGSDPQAAQGRGEKLEFDRLAQPVVASQLRLLHASAELPLDSLTSFASGTSIRILWRAPELLRISGAESAWIEYLSTGLRQDYEGLLNLPVQTDVLLFEFPMPQAPVSGFSRLHLEFFKDRAGNTLDPLVAGFKVDKGPDFGVKLFQNPVDPLAFGFVMKPLDFDGRDDAILMDSSVPTPRAFFSQAGSPEIILNLEALRTAQIGSQTFGTGFSGAFRVDISRIGDVDLRFQAQDFRGHESEHLIRLHVRVPAPYQSSKDIRASRSTVISTSQMPYLVGERGDIEFPALVEERGGRKIIPLSRFPHLFYPQGQNLQAVGSLPVLSGCKGLVFVEIGVEGRMGTPSQKLACKADRLEFDLRSKAINRVLLVRDIHSPTLMLIDELGQRDPGLNLVEVESMDAQTAVSEVTLEFQGRSYPMRMKEEGVFQASLVLKSGEQWVNISAADLAGNKVSKSFGLEVLKPFALERCAIYPNPVRDFAHLDCRFTREPHSFSAKLYDASGARIRTYDFGLDRVILEELELMSESLYELQNGVYFLEIRSSYAGIHLKKVLKFALLR